MACNLHGFPQTSLPPAAPQLVSSKARVVTVSSITHRTVRIKDARAFLTDWRAGYYEYTKLANVYFAYELQR
jgi:WW domain-containing oxidoreductase